MDMVFNPRDGHEIPIFRGMGRAFQVKGIQSEKRPKPRPSTTL